MKIFRAEEDLGVSPLSAFRACGGPLVSLRVRRSHPFHRAGGSFFRRGGAARPPKRHARRPRCGGSPCCGRARPPDAAERPYTPVTGPYIYRHAKRPKSCTRFAFFPKNFFVPPWMRTKFFASRWEGDRNGEKRAAARWGHRSVVPQGMGIKMRRKRAGLPGGLAKTDRKQSARRGETGAAVSAPPHGSRTGRARGAGCILFLQRADACAKKALKFQSRKTGGAKGGRPCRSAAA